MSAYAELIVPLVTIAGLNLLKNPIILLMCKKIEYTKQFN